MDQIDINLLDAWQRIGETCRHNRIKMMNRCKRQFRDVLKRPPRPWCLVLRAADRRINSYTAATTCEGDEDRQYEHAVTITGDLVRRITAPVYIDWPGVPTWVAARKLGVSPHMAWLWARKGFLRIERYDYGGCHSRPGKRIPIVWTPSPIDPNSPACRAPDPLWGTLWQHKQDCFPDDFAQTITRVPRIRPRKHRDDQFRGWDWRCPGLLGANGEFSGCGRLCKYLYGPLPIFTLAKSSGLMWEFEMPESSRLAGTWRPGMHQSEIGHGQRMFACKECWNVRNITLSNATGWNEFVAYISGGLLYGKDVPRPMDEVPLKRKRRPNGCGRGKRGVAIDAAAEVMPKPAEPHLPAVG